MPGRLHNLICHHAASSSKQDQLKIQTWLYDSFPSGEQEANIKYASYPLYILYMDIIESIIELSVSNILETLRKLIKFYGFNMFPKDLPFWVHYEPTQRKILIQRQDCTETENELINAII